jgi:hypothetical protein
MSSRPDNQKAAVLEAAAGCYLPEAVTSRHGDEFRGSRSGGVGFEAD